MTLMALIICSYLENLPKELLRKGYGSFNVFNWPFWKSFNIEHQFWKLYYLVRCDLQAFTVIDEPSGGYVLTSRSAY